MEKIENAKTLPKVYFGLHMVEGVAEYADMNTVNGQPYRIFVGEQTIKNMDASFQGRPVYVHHVDDVNMENLQAEADGYVVRSFFNKADGKHWAEFLIVSDRGHEAIRNGWKLSNAYHIKNSGAGGRWHAVDYTKEVLQGEYEHLAIVPNPRYDESIILTPDQFKEYNERKLNELERLSNSVKEKKSMFNFFKKQKVENSEIKLEEYVVILPKTGKEICLADLITNADKEEEKPSNMGKYCNGEDLVKLGEEEMTLNTLLTKYNTLMEKEKAAMQNQEQEEEKKENEEEEEKKENAIEEKKQEVEQSEEFKKVANAEAEYHKSQASKKVEVSQDRVNRGINRYGSKK